MKRIYHLLGIFLVLTMLFMNTGFVNSKITNDKIEKKVYDSVLKDGKTKVIILLKENYLTEKEKIFVKTKIIDKIDRRKVTKEFDSFNGFSANLNQTEIEELSKLDVVEKIYPDQPIKLLVQDSVKIIEANNTWLMQTEGVNLTGKGQTVCVVDTGVNYSHPDLGGCTISNLSLAGNQILLSSPVQSSHNYHSNFEYTWKINYTGFSKIAVHFINISTESHFDYIDLYDGNNNLISTYSGIKDDFWSPSVSGDTIYVKLTTDLFVNDYGFYIDKIINGTSTLTYNWSNCTRIIGGWDVYNGDPDPMDDNGHGTHVAGIIAANGGLIGVAPQTNIFAIKVFSSGEEGTTDSDVIKGIELCTNNSEQYNISVISMSLGGSTLYTNYCDGDLPLYSAAINSAVDKNISVVIASGNDASAAGISAPACIQKAVPVSAVTKLNVIDESYANRNWMVKLFAPGTNINSTRWNPLGNNAYCTEAGNYMICQGTSMATPFVSAAIAIFNQYLKSINLIKTSSEIEDLLWRTGKTINDSENLSQNFSRIDVYSALREIDATSPNITLSLPVNNFVNISQNKTFICNASDWQLSNITLYLWNYTGIYLNETKNISGTINSTNFNLIEMPSGEYHWNCLASDKNGNSAFAQNNFSLYNDGIVLSLVSPINNTYTHINETVFNCTATASQDRQIKNISFFIFENETSINFSSVNLTGNLNSSLFNFTFVNQTNYIWGCEVYTNESDHTTNNYTIYYDVACPILTTIIESSTAGEVAITWSTNEETNYSISLQNKLNSSFDENHNLIISDLTASTMYEYNLTYCDRAGNCNISLESFRTGDISAVISSGGGGGGSGGGATTSTLTEAQFSAGVMKKFSIGEKANMNINGQNHSLQLNKIVNNSVNITLRSQPINFVMVIGEEKRINLTSLEYYDLYIKVENTTKNYANLTIKKINEEIFSKTNNKTSSGLKEGVEDTNLEDNTNIPKKLSNNSIFIVLAICFGVLFLLVLFLKRNKKKKTK